MSSTGKMLRMGNLTKKDGKTFIVPFDHGMWGVTLGMEDITESVTKVMRGGADGVLLNIGAARKVANIIKGKMGLVLSIPYDPKYVVLAAKLGASAVKTTYFGPVPLSEQKYNEISAIGQACEEWGVPFMAEVVPTDEKGKVLYDVNLVKMAARIGCELGGDIVKTAYAGTTAEYKEIVRACHAPIVVMGGAKMDSPLDVLNMVRSSMDAGAIGGTIGRNVWQYKDPEKMTKAIVSIIHGNMSVEEASKLLL